MADRGWGREQKTVADQAESTGHEIAKQQIKEGAQKAEQLIRQGKGIEVALRGECGANMWHTCKESLSPVE